MDEARRFLRYVIPGLSFAVQAILLLSLLIPSWTWDKVSGLSDNDAIGIAIAALFGSGGLGFVFSIFHHSLFWMDRDDWLTRKLAGPVDYTELIARLQERKFLYLLDAHNGNVLDGKLNRFQAWAIVTSLWHERIVTSEKMSGKIKSADPRADSLTNLVHANGTARVASYFAVLLAFGITDGVYIRSFETFDVLHYIMATVIAVTLLIFHQGGYERTGRMAQSVTEQILTDALAEESYNGPVQTNIVLKAEK